MAFPLTVGKSASSASDKSPSSPPPATKDPWQAEDDVRTLLRAHDVKRDPARHTAAKRHAKKQLRGLKAVAGKPSP